MSTVISNISSNTATAAEGLSNIVSNITSKFIVTPSIYPSGVNGFVFDVIDDEEITLDADITDSFIETGGNIQDHIVWKPIKFTLRGYMGELNDVTQIQGANSPFSVNELANVAGLMNQFSSGASQVYAKMVQTASQVQSIITNVSNIASLVGMFNPTQTRQQQAYVKFNNFWKSGIPCTIQTPFSFLTSMYVESVRALQTGKSRIVGDFTVTFKQVQQTSTVMSENVNIGDPTNSATQGIAGSVGPVDLGMGLGSI